MSLMVLILEPFALLVINLLLTDCSTELLDLWLSELNGNKIRVLVGLKQHISGKAYLRGFTRGIFGTLLFPIFVPTDGSSNATKNFSVAMQDIVYETGLTVKQNYELYVTFVRSYFCTTDDQKYWQCCDLPTFDDSCEIIPHQTREVMHVLMDPVQSISVFFLYHWCIRAWEDYRHADAVVQRSLKSQIELYCPDPCYGDPCAYLQGVKNPFSCKTVGPFENEYICDCNTMHEWDPNLQLCVPRNPCLNRQFPPCVLENILSCIATGQYEAHCVCKTEFMGPDCSLPRDACIERLNQSSPTGYANCQVQHGNKCYPILGTDYYTCTCVGIYTPSLTVDEDNCLNRVDPCWKANISAETGLDSLDHYKSSRRKKIEETGTEVTHSTISCLNGGTCISSADFSRSFCVCPKSTSGETLFTGMNCETTIGVWSDWSLPSACFPQKCGKTRYQWRRRKCLNTSDLDRLTHIEELPKVVYYNLSGTPRQNVYCIGTTEEVMPCEPLAPCSTLRLPSRMREELFDYQSLYYFGLITMAQVIFSGLSWYVVSTPILQYIHTRQPRESIPT
ncbi:hypothetical protein PHET_07004 [Paragonimus heterotremus]|uniref:EGF-like domain-containing protein n=1 Tax=Paragonimus heterotremus TaxID=100268 RepID=A0A8J4SN65_9TREM|nr:hypothetical protein PHET_07004 [Paragonimus heterotremus]